MRQWREGRGTMRKLVSPNVRLIRQTRARRDVVRKIAALCLAIAILTSLASCALYTSHRLDREQKRLDEAKEKWEAAGLSDYVMEVKAGSIFCLGYSEIPFRVLVDDGEITSSYNVNDPLDPRSFCIHRTTDDVFSDIQGAINARWDGIHVEYDKDLGYPKKIRLSNDQIDDSIFLWTVIKFSTDLDSFRQP